MVGVSDHIGSLATHTCTPTDGTLEHQNDQEHQEQILSNTNILISYSRVLTLIEAIGHLGALISTADLGEQAENLS